ncbi:F-box protein At5g49610-like [Triticum urartu]|uniref:F-box protein At5g49610-like n=1 Tax=Triticum urartu TaxID=4572 RepID=UPI002043DD0D|nr:F-box protein At5g49610-like [Triticum urartu]
MVNGTSCKRGLAAVAALPDELFQWEILARLPAKELLRCRLVCRSWCRLASDAHHRRQPSLPLVFFRTKGNEYTAHAAVDALDIRRTPAARRPVLAYVDYNYSRRNFTLHASCDGLILISYSNHRFYLCNPATRQWCALPDLTGGNVAALYPHHPSGEYRILYWKRPNNSDDNVVYYYVLTVGKKERCVGLPVASSSIKKDRSCWHLHACHHPPVLLHDCLHWYTVNAFDGEIIIFDTLAESFRWIQSPTACSSAQLLQMDGTLGIGQIDVGTMTVKAWVLQDYKVEVWSSKCTTELPEEYVVHGKVLSENGDVLVNNRCFYNSKGELLEKLPWQSVRPRILGLYHKESLVRHVFFRRKENGSRVRLPRFFRGLQGNIN